MLPIKSASKPAAGLSKTMFSLPPYFGPPKVVVGTWVVVVVVDVVLVAKAVVDKVEAIVVFGAVVELEAIVDGVVCVAHDENTKTNEIK